MPTSIKYLPEYKIVETIYQGVVTPEELQVSLVNAIAMTHQEKTGLILSDLRDMTQGHSVIDIFYFLSQIDLNTVAHITKEALVMPVDEAAADNVKFYETTSQNRGLNARIFPDRESALQWLNS